MSNKPGPNDPCPCGSGKKTTKCCGVCGGTVGYTTTDRGTAYEKLSDLVDAEFSEEEDDAFESLWQRWGDDAHELPEDDNRLIEAVSDAWGCFATPMAR